METSNQTHKQQTNQNNKTRNGSPNHNYTQLHCTSAIKTAVNSECSMVSDHLHPSSQPPSPPQHEPVSIEIVYELASTIGEEFKRLLEFHGSEEQLTGSSSANNSPRQQQQQRLLPTVVRVLEYLEEAVLQREDYQRLVEEQQRTIDDQRAQQERTVQERKQQMKYLSEIEEVDESWRRENRKLAEYVNYLKGENKRLASSLNEKLTQSLTDLKPNHEGEVINGDTETETTNSQLSRRVSLLVKELRLKSEEAEQLKTANEALTEENANLRHLNATIRSNMARRKDEEVKVESKETDDERYHLLEEKVRSLEAQIEVYKRKLKASQDQLLEQQQQVNNNNNEEGDKEVEAAEEAIPIEDLPVQGPIPKEPDFYRSNRKSRIWSFFPRLTRALIK